MALSFDDRKRFADFFRIFIAVDRRTKKKCKQKKTQKTKSKSDELGPRIRGPSFYYQLIYHVSTCISILYHESKRIKHVKQLAIFSRSSFPITSCF